MDTLAAAEHAKKVSATVILSPTHTSSHKHPPSHPPGMLQSLGLDPVALNLAHHSAAGGRFDKKVGSQEVDFWVRFRVSEDV